MSDRLDDLSHFFTQQQISIQKRLGLGIRPARTHRYVTPDELVLLTLKDSVRQADVDLPDRKVPKFRYHK